MLNSFCLSYIQVWKWGISGWARLLVVMYCLLLWKMVRVRWLLMDYTCMFTFNDMHTHTHTHTHTHIGTCVCMHDHHCICRAYEYWMGVRWWGVQEVHGKAKKVLSVCCTYHKTCVPSNSLKGINFVPTYTHAYTCAWAHTCIYKRTHTNAHRCVHPMHLHIHTSLLMAQRMNGTIYIITYVDWFHYGTAQM